MKVKDKAHPPTVAVDFDGVLHQYKTPWINPHTIPDPPIAGAIEWLHDTVQHFRVIILSTRCSTWRGRRAIRAWLKQHSGMLWYDGPGYVGIEEVICSFKKHPAYVYIDDRAWRFTGANYPSKDEIYKARPWNKPARASTS